MRGFSLLQHSILLYRITEIDNGKLTDLFPGVLYRMKRNMKHPANLRLRVTHSPEFDNFSITGIKFSQTFKKKIHIYR